MLKALPAEFRKNENDVECLRVFCEVAVLSLNALSARRHPVPLGADPPSRAQRASLVHISSRCFDILRRFSQLPLHGLIEEHHLESFEPSSAAPRPEIVANDIDLPVRAATCDPRRLVTSHMRDTLDHISDIFPDRPIGVKNVRVGKRDMPEYVRFVRRMLEVDKVQLITDPKGVASFFVVGKPGKSRLRPIWSVDVISSETKRPPMPRRLGNPASFVDIVVAKDERLFFSNRDAASFFDTLEAPHAHALGFAFLLFLLHCSARNSVSLLML